MELNKTCVTDGRFIVAPVPCHAAATALWRLCCRPFSSLAREKLLLLRSVVRSLLSPPPPPVPAAFIPLFYFIFSLWFIWCKSKQNFVKFPSRQLATLDFHARFRTDPYVGRWKKELGDGRRRRVIFQKKTKTTGAMMANILQEVSKRPTIEWGQT